MLLNCPVNTNYTHHHITVMVMCNEVMLPHGLMEEWEKGKQNKQFAEI